MLKRKNKFIPMFLLFLLALSIRAAAAQAYVHDPMADPRAAKDIIVDPEAVYGYRPNPESTRLAPFADMDFTDEALVLEKQAERVAYHESMEGIYEVIRAMRAEGKSAEEIARVASPMRNQLRIDAYKNDPEGLEKMKQSNLASYGDENGGSPDYFYNKYGSWETVVEKTVSANEGLDAVLGLYDKYYYTYTMAGEPAQPTVPAPAQDQAIASTASEQVDATVAAAPEQPDGNGTYTVIPGDSLSRIAGRKLGDSSLWTTIYDLNKDAIRDPDLIYPGQVLTLPGAAS